MSVNTDKPLPRGPPLPPSRSGSSFYQPSQADHDGNMNSHRPSSHVGGQNGAATGQQRRTESGMGYGTASRVEEPEYYGNRGPAHEPPRNHPGATSPNGGASVSHARHWDTHESMRSGHESRGFRQTFKEMSGTSNKLQKPPVQRKEVAQDPRQQNGRPSSGQQAHPDDRATLQTENQLLRQQVQELDKNCDDLKRRNNLMQSTFDSREDLTGRQEVDAEIQARFRQIFEQIKAWTNKFCKEAHPLEMGRVARDKTSLSRLQAVVPGLKELGDLPRELPAGNQKRRRQFIRGWIAVNVGETMFRSLPAPPHPLDAGRDIWIPARPRDAIAELELTLIQSGDAITKRAFHEWRALTLSLFTQMYPAEKWPLETKASIQAAAEDTFDLLRLLAPSVTDLDEQKTRLVDNIFTLAAEVSQLLRRQRACWYVRFPHGSPSQNSLLLFDVNSMRCADVPDGEDDEGAAQSNCEKAVTFVIAPSLVKSGNHDGDQYESERYVEKAEVSCSDIQSSGT